MAQTATPRHPVAVAAAHLHAELDAVAEASVWSMDAAETGQTLASLARAKARIAELEARVAAHAEFAGVGDDVAASSTAAWLAHATRQTRGAAAATMALGRGLEAHPATRDALAAGRICVDQARAIIHAVDELPDDLDGALVVKAEAHLLELARDYDARRLTGFGKHLFEVIAPEEADAREAALLEAEEAAAAKACHLTMVDDGHGKTRGTFTLPTVHGATLRKMLAAIAAPKHQHATKGAGNSDGFGARPTPEALGQALCELIERYPAHDLPDTGGVSATMVVLIDVDTLMGRLEKAGVLDTGDKMSPAMARRLACEAGLIPVVLDGESQPIDVGREKRHYDKHQRVVMLARDGGCRAEGCDRTTGLHAHHKRRWVDGGRTDLANGLLLCGWHHQRAHDTRYETIYHANGNVTFHRTHLWVSSGPGGSVGDRQG